MTPADVEPGPRAAPVPPPRRATASFMLSHPAHLLALGFGSGLPRLAPGTVGTLWAWVSFLVLDIWLDEFGWSVMILASLVVGLWACTRTAHALGQVDPSAIVWDEIVAFWIVLWLLTPAGFWMQLLAFALFRGFDAAKPGPVGWADRCLEHRESSWARGAGILLDDLVAAGCTLVVLAVGVAVVEVFG